MDVKYVSALRFTKNYGELILPKYFLQVQVVFENRINLTLNGFRPVYPFNEN